MSHPGRQRSGEEDVRVFVVDDHGVVRRGMRAYLEMTEDIRVVGEATDGQEALEAIESLVANGEQPDVVMMDLLMPRMDGIAATEAVKKRWPAIDVVAMTSFSEAGRVHRALEAGGPGSPLTKPGGKPTRGG